MNKKLRLSGLLLSTLLLSQYQQVTTVFAETVNTQQEEKYVKATLETREDKPVLVVSSTKDIKNVVVSVKTDKNEVLHVRIPFIKANTEERLDVELEKATTRLLPKTSTVRETLTLHEEINGRPVTITIRYDIEKAVVDELPVSVTSLEKHDTVSLTTTERQPSIEKEKEQPKPQEQPKVEQPTVEETPKVDTPVDTQPVETPTPQPVVPAPQPVAPKEEPVAPKVEQPKEEAKPVVEETPKVESPVDAQPVETPAPQPIVSAPQPVAPKEEPVAPKVEQPTKPTIAQPRNLVRYTQDNAPYSSRVYGNYTIGSTGCVPTALASIFTELKGTSVSPIEVADYLYNSTSEFNRRFVGTSGKGVALASAHFGLTAEVLRTVEDVKEALKQGHLVYAAVSGQEFTPGSSHAIILTGYDEEGQTTVYNPISYKQVKKYDVHYIWAHQSWDSDDRALGTPFIVIK
ncbi:C39 family peptidase [Carnobacteriaceae bacterium zg-ZUI78]|nr:C39 family peptidase [Carnobacteriaceae bacterium zg-ZUI78]